ncbi:Protein of unknown function [Pyronema omphalodes CBS 100304]|uniref:Uncharacterized protein n=1 Tax=Pyronema omphalodes (strain CBS 100304) TaxID=1076935 RepID=U4L9P7_PYROM|nr:Protein of unknown function [Pyronema omphalodes CBS 100304]
MQGLRCWIRSQSRVECAWEVAERPLCVLARRQ